MSLSVSLQNFNKTARNSSNDCSMKYYTKFRNDVAFRRKMLHTICLYGAMTSMGIALGQVGPAFLELQTISGVGMKKGSWMLSAMYIGYMVGAIVGGVLYNRFTRSLQFSVNNLIMATALAVLPWCRWFGLMTFTFFVSGITYGYIDSVAHPEILNLWGKNSKPPMQALHFLYSGGLTVSPLFTIPFLSNVDESVKVPGYNSELKPDTKNDSSHDVSIRLNTWNISQGYYNVSHVTLNEESTLFVAYLISVSFALVISTCFVLFYFSYEHKDDKTGIISTNTLSSSKSESDQGRQLPLPLKITTCCIMVSLMAVFAGIEDTYLSFLSAYSVKQLNWSKAEGSFLTFISCIFVVFGRCVNIFLSKCVNDKLLITFHCIGVLVSFVSFLLSSLHYWDIGIWISASVFGYSASAIFAGVFTWMNHVFTTVTGTISSVFMVFSTISMAINPLILGFLMERFSALWFCYLFIIESGVVVVLCVLAVILSRYVEGRYGLTKGTVKISNQKSANESILKT